MQKYKLFLVTTVTLCTIWSSLFSSVSAAETGYSITAQDRVLADRATAKLTTILLGKNEAYRTKLLSQLTRARDTTASNNPRINALLGQVINALTLKANENIVPVTNTSNNNTVSVDQFLNNLSKQVTAADFQLKIAQAIYKVWWFESRDDYMSLYDSLSSFYKDVLSTRYGITDRISFDANVGKNGLNFKFTPYDLIWWKYVPFSSSTLAITSKPTKDDVILDASGSLVGVQVTVFLPGMVTSSSKTGKKDYGKQGAPTSVFVSKTGEVFPSYFGLVRTLATGGWIEVNEFFKVTNKTALSIGKTQGTATDDQAKIFGELWFEWPENSIHGITATIKNSNNDIVWTIEGVQDEKVEKGFISGGFTGKLVLGQEYTVEIRSTFDIKYHGIEKTKPYATVKFRY